MKKIILILTLFLSGCVTSAHFDNNEYASVVRLEVYTRQISTSCENPTKVKMMIDQLESDVEYLVTYTKFLKVNKSTHEIALVLQSQVKELKQAYEKGTPTDIYCQVKLKILNIEIQRALEAIAKKVK